MDCEQAANFISARIDGQIAPADAASLDAHLAGCAACRSALEAAEMQDAALLRAFDGGRHAAAAMADRVVAEIERTSALPSATATASAATGRSGEGPRRWWIGWITAAAAGFILAILLVRPARPPVPPIGSRPMPTPVTPAAEPVARLSLASGDVFTCPSHTDQWEPIAAGAAVSPGSKVRTADAAKCELALPGGSRLRLNAGTELQFTAGGDVTLAGGQMWSAVPPNAGPLRIAAGGTRITTGATAAKLDITCAANTATVNVVEGSARVDGADEATTVQSGESLQVPPPQGMSVAMCTPIVDSLHVTRWIDDLLLLMPEGDPELAARVDALLSRIVAERDRKSATSGVGPVERDVRARGDAWAAPIAHYARRQLAVITDADAAKRRTAASLLADLATPATVPDLVELLADADSEVRRHACLALHRLTGQTLGFSPEHCASNPRDPAPAAAWRNWLQRSSSPIPLKKS